MAPLLCVTFGPVFIKFFETHAEVFGRSRWRDSGKYHLSIFSKPPRGSKTMEPHLTCDDPGVPAKQKDRIWFRYDPEAFKAFFVRLDQAIVRGVLERQVRVELEDLETNEWVSTFIPDDVADALVESWTKSKRLKLSVALAWELFELSVDHLVAVSDLNTVVDQAPGDPRRRCFSLLRINEHEELEHAFVGWRLGADGSRNWYLTPPGDVVDRGLLRRFLVEALPPTFFESLVTINAKLGLSLQREEILALLEEARSHEPAA